MREAVASSYKVSPRALAAQRLLIGADIFKFEASVRVRHLITCVSRVFDYNSGGPGWGGSVRLNDRLPHPIRPLGCLRRHRSSSGSECAGYRKAEGIAVRL